MASIVSGDRFDDALDRALADARASLESDLRAVTHELSDAAVTALASSAEALDRAASLADVLRGLLDAASGYADCAGVFLVRDGGVRPWRLNGVDERALSSIQVDHATTFPVVVGGQTVAILYAEGGAPRAGALDVLTRYAGRLLESRTLHLALGIAAP